MILIGRDACPKHGDEFMVKDGNFWYCAAPDNDPNSPFSKCWYHPQNTKPTMDKKPKIVKHKITKGDVIQRLCEDYISVSERTGRDASNVTNIYKS